MLVLKSDRPEATEAFAAKLAGLIKNNIYLCLKGDLGAGKTLFSQAFAKALGYDGAVTSPTFNLMNIYEGKKKIYHYDLYRLQSEDELYDMGFFDYIQLDDDEVALVEWPDAFMDAMPEDYLLLEIIKVSERERELHLSCIGDKYQEIYQEMSK